MSSHEKTVEQLTPVIPQEATIPNLNASDLDLERDGSINSTSNLLQRYNRRFETLTGLESRGISRVPPDERLAINSSSYWGVGLLWVSCQIGPVVATFGMLGPLVYQLSFLDSAMCAVFGCTICSAVVAAVSLWGPISGNRTMIVTRWFMGYWPTKLTALLQVVVLIGYGMIDAIIGGQILSAVSGGTLSIVVSIVISSAVTLAVCFIGMRWVHYYERWQWIPVLAVFLILTGCAGPHFDTSAPSQGDQATINANRLTFFSLCLSGPIAWAPSAADYFTYYPETTNRWRFALTAFFACWLTICFDLLLGIGLASGVASNPDWAAAYQTSEGALFYAGLEPLGQGFAGVCGVILSFSIIANNTPGIYSAALGIQILGRYGLAVPRWIWAVLCTVIFTVCAAVGQEQLFNVVNSFLPLMGYWVIIWLCIMFEEHFIFNRGDLTRYHWDSWNDKRKLPVGFAALVAFLVGWAGAIVAMNQVYWAGPIARLVGDQGIDLGFWVAMGFTLLSFPPIRWLELRIVGR